MVSWIDGRGQFVSAHSTARVEQAEWKPQGSDPDIVVISSDPRLMRPNFDRCRRDKFCRCRSCKPSLAVA